MDISLQNSMELTVQVGSQGIPPRDFASSPHLYVINHPANIYPNILIFTGDKCKSRSQIGTHICVCS
jgi:hypothetical protein